jgi:uncharacterized protein YcgI (DUF1989 family)
MLWEETAAAGGYASKILRRGARVRLLDVQADAYVSMLLFNAKSPAAQLNVADTVKVQWTPTSAPAVCCFGAWGGSGPAWAGSRPR